MLTALSFLGVFAIGAMVGAAKVYYKSQNLFVMNKSLRINYEILRHEHNDLKKDYWQLILEYNATLDRFYDLSLKTEIYNITNTETGDK